MIEIQKDSKAGYRFEIKAKSGNVLLRSIPYASKGETEKAVQELFSMQVTRNHFERKTDHKGRFLFSLHNGQGKVLGISQFYDSEMGLENGIKNLMLRINNLSDSENL